MEPSDVANWQTPLHQGLGDIERLVVTELVDQKHRSGDVGAAQDVPARQQGDRRQPGQLLAWEPRLKPVTPRCRACGDDDRIATELIKRGDVDAGSQLDDHSE